MQRTVSYSVHASTVPYFIQFFVRLILESLDPENSFFGSHGYIFGRPTKIKSVYRHRAEVKGAKCTCRVKFVSLSSCQCFYLSITISYVCNVLPILANKISNNINVIMKSVELFRSKLPWG